MILSTTSTAIIGSFSVLQKRALVGDTLAHALLPGICLGFLSMPDQAAIYMTLGAFMAGSIALILIEQITRHTKIKKDTTMALIIASSMGIGIFLLTYIQQRSSTNQAGLKNFLFGHISTLMQQDLFIFTALASLLISITTLFFKAFSTISFDPDFTKTIGWPTHLLNLLLQGLTILTIIAGMRALGSLMIGAILVLPAATARFWTDRIKTMVLLAAFFASISSIAGIIISYLLADLPTGPCIVLFIITFALLSCLLAPRHGWLFRKYKRHTYQQKVLLENVLKRFYELGKQDGNYYQTRSLHDIKHQTHLTKKNLQKALKKLTKKGFTLKKKDTWQLTTQGKAKGKHMLNLHMLWEAYLMRYLNIQPDHVHDDAESTEHLLTTDIEAALKHVLQ